MNELLTEIRKYWSERAITFDPGGYRMHGQLPFPNENDHYSSQFSPQLRKIIKTETNGFVDIT